MLSIFLTIVIIAVLVWLVTYLFPIPDRFKTAIWVVAAVGILVYLAAAIFGVVPVWRLR